MDQPFWGQRVADLGVGPRPIPHRRLSVEGLAAAITTAVTDKEIQRRAAALGEHIRAEDGVARAVEMINRHLSLARPGSTGGQAAHILTKRNELI